MTWRIELQNLIRNGRYRRQGELVAALAELGLEVTQSSVSRELGIRGVQKVEGWYRLPSTGVVPAPIHSIGFTSSDCLGVIRTDPAFASVVGQFIDDSNVDSVLGTVCGDDTVFVALRENTGRGALITLLGLE